MWPWRHCVIGTYTPYTRLESNDTGWLLLQATGKHTKTQPVSEPLIPSLLPAVSITSKSKSSAKEEMGK